MKELEKKHAQRQKLDRKDFITSAEGDTQPGVVDTRLFEVPLSTILERADEPGPIPVFMDEIMSFIEAKYMGREGIFRVPGAAAEVKKLKDRINAGQRIDLENEPIINKEHTICALVKTFFRDLPEPLLTFQRFDDFVIVASE